MHFSHTVDTLDFSKSPVGHGHSQAELGHPCPHDATDDGAGVYADTQRDRLLVVRHQHVACFSHQGLGKAKDVPCVATGVCRDHTAEAILIHLNEPTSDDVTITNSLHLWQTVHHECVSARYHCTPPSGPKPQG